MVVARMDWWQGEWPGGARLLVWFLQEAHAATFIACYALHVDFDRVLTTFVEFFEREKMRHGLLELFNAIENPG